MAMRDNVLNAALDAVEDILDNDLEAQFTLDNAKYGWNLTKPNVYHRGQVATVASTKTPTILIYSDQEKVVQHAMQTGDHSFRVVLVLALSAKDVKPGATADDLYRAIVLYGSRIMLVLSSDVTDMSGRFRDVGVFRLQEGVSFYNPPLDGPTTSSSHIQAKFTFTLTQRRLQYT